MKTKANTEKRRYVFYNSQEPGMPKTFSKNSLRGGWKKLILHGATVELTDDQFDFIMKKATPTYHYQNDPSSGQLHATKIDEVPRFSLRPVR